ncbi:MAG TPA: hypothetical protein PKL77_06235 [Candidatus Omnitrophota bacterium]|nr:hypothetical protein [Candidatus Omnitrophota bacterium]
MALQNNAGTPVTAQPEGVKVQETAEPETGTYTSDESEEEEETEEESEDSETTSEPSQPQSKPDPKQTAEENAKYAAIRRSVETEAKVKMEAEVKRRSQEAADKTVADMGILDPYSGKAITTKAQYDAYKARRDSEVAAKELTKAGISAEAINSIIDSHPAVVKAKQAAADMEAAKQRANAESAKASLETQMKEISALDPSIKTIDDVAALPCWGSIKNFIGKGLTLTEAFKQANFDNLVSKSASAAKQSTYNSVTGKDHLTSSASRGQGEVTVPKGVMNQYRAMFPDMTAEQIRADYARQNKKK